MRVNEKWACPDCGVDCDRPDFYPPATAKLMCRACFSEWVDSFADGERLDLPSLLCILEPKELAS